MPEAEALESIVAALRIRQDEVRFNVALATACTLRPQNGGDLARAILRSAASDPSASGRAEHLLATVPASLRSSDQVATNPLTLGRGRDHRRSGFIDLVLRDLRGFALAVELKIGERGYDEGQLMRYLQTGLPVAALVPRRVAHPAMITQSDLWLGEATWTDVLGALEQFNLPTQAGGVWRALLGVMRDDGDFGRDRRTGSGPSQLGNDTLECVRARTSAPCSEPEWDDDARLWLLGIPDLHKPVVAIALDLEEFVPFAAVMGADIGPRSSALVRDLGAVRQGQDIFVSIALSLDERLDPTRRLPDLLNPIVERFIVCRNFHRPPSH